MKALFAIIATLIFITTPIMADTQKQPQKKQKKDIPMFIHNTRKIVTDKDLMTTYKDSIHCVDVYADSVVVTLKSQITRK
ncbi:MAG: hypothetical protein K2J65_01110 [Duncaniella sp.]|nr:hypothetical protein [Duncaniella sp.]MDE6858996.1 hypothetical protein [Duncaniella sp.]MDE7145680.1 hypothetical protein [Duncaniella sp.]